MARSKKLWGMSVGARGASVRVYERTPGGPLWLRWWVPASPTERGHRAYRPLEHRNRDLAAQTAREIAGQLLAATYAEARGTTTLAEVLSAYQADVADHTKGQGPREAKRRAVIWTTFLGASRDINTLDHPTIDRFARERRAGRLALPPESGFALRGGVSDRAVGADVEYLRAALNHACRIVRPSGKRMLVANPVAGYALPRNKNPRRPVATYDRFLAVVKHADNADPQRLFSAFMQLVESLGWRVSAICALRWSDVDLTASPSAPRGRVFKRAEHDKEGRAMWVPLSKSAQQAFKRIREVNPGVGEWPVFPAPRAKSAVPDRDGDAAIPKPWTRHHARKLLERAEARANLGHQVGSDFHAYRRKWSTERKHLPDADVMAAGGWSDPRALKASYQHVDDATLLAVVNEPTKLRETGAVKRARRA